MSMFDRRAGLDYAHSAPTTARILPPVSPNAPFVFVSVGGPGDRLTLLSEVIRILETNGMAVSAFDGYAYISERPGLDIRDYEHG